MALHGASLTLIDENPDDNVTAILSHAMPLTLLPGDLIMTGTPAGVGPLAAGDEVRAAGTAVAVQVRPAVTILTLGAAGSYEAGDGYRRNDDRMHPMFYPGHPGRGRFENRDYRRGRGHDRDDRRGGFDR